MANEKTNVVNEQEAPAYKTATKWQALEEAKLIPTEIVCDGYRPFHAFNNGCHSKLRLDVDQMIAHIKAGHGGGFMLKMRKGDKPWAGWKQLAEKGIEAIDFRCENCDAVIPFHPVRILTPHMNPHTGKQRRVLPGGLYNITLSIGKPIPTEAEAAEDFE